MSDKASQKPHQQDELLIQQLALLEADPSMAADPTVESLKSELETIVSDLHSPPPINPFQDESACRRANELVRAIGREPSFVAGQSLDAEIAPPVVGEVGQYRLLEKLGQGGMGTVYKALHTSLKRLVALKVLPTERMKNQQAVDRFHREMEAVGQLDHSNIVRATDAGEIDDMHYLVMELVDGIDLSALVRAVGPAGPFGAGLTTPPKSPTEGLPESALDGEGGRPSVDEAAKSGDLATTPARGMTLADACELIRQAAVGLAHADRRGMVHRDIKPSNLMLAHHEESGPVVKILDMGLALLDDQQAAARRELTTTGQMMGTLDYMAPEQGTDSHDVDIRADIYALGATLFKLLTGGPPFSAETYNTPLKLMMAKTTEDASSIATERADLPAELVAIVDRMLSRDPADRFATPDDVAVALTPFTEGADLAGLLQRSKSSATAPTEQSGRQTHEDYAADSHETEPTIHVKSGPCAPREEADARDELSAPLPPPPKPVLAPDLALGAGLPTPPKPPTEGLRDAAAQLESGKPSEQRSGRPAVDQVARSGDLATTASATQAQRWWTNRRNQIIAVAAGLAGIILLGVVTLFFRTKDGTIVVEIDDPSIQVTVEGEELKITKKESGEEYQIKAGERTLHVKYGELDFKTDQFTLRRGEKVVLSVRLAKGEVQVLDGKNVIGRKLAGDSTDAVASRVSPKEGSSITAADGWVDLMPLVVLPKGAGYGQWVRYGPDLVAVGDDVCRLPLPVLPHGGYALRFSFLNGSSSLRVALPINNHHAAITIGEHEITLATPVGGRDEVIHKLEVPGFGNDPQTLVIAVTLPSDGKVQITVDSEDKRVFDWTGQESAFSDSQTRWPEPFSIAVAATETPFTELSFQVLSGEAELLRGPNPLAHDRRVAKWALANGFTNVRLCVGKVVMPALSPGDPLPDEPFHVHALCPPEKLAYDDFKQLDGLTGLSWINFQRGHMMDEVLASLPELPSLNALLTYGAKVTDAGLAHLRKFPNLTRLSLGFPDYDTSTITNDGLRHVSQLKRLERLDLPRCTKITDEGLVHIAKCEQITLLNFHRTGITGTGLSQLASLKKLGSLSLDGCPVTDDGLSHITRFDGFGGLGLSSTRITDEGIRHSAFASAEIY